VVARDVPADARAIHARCDQQDGPSSGGHAAFADLEHIGRKSGIVRHTPVRAFRVGDTVVIGLNFGRQSDWYQNIKAADACRIRLGGKQLTLGAPALVPAEQAAKDLPWLFSFALRYVVRTTDCVQLPVLHSAASVTRGSTPASKSSTSRILRVGESSPRFGRDCVSPAVRSRRGR
jgi:deazaflavin-dependent oxidoreductase (nitroreductase family)